MESEKCIFEGITEEDLIRDCQPIDNIITIKEDLEESELILEEIQKQIREQLGISDDMTIEEYLNVKPALNHNEFGDIVISEGEKRKSTYTEAHFRAQKKYREKYPEKYLESQKKFYDRKKQDEEWKKKFNERSRMNNKIYRDRLKEKMLAEGIEPKPRGRPKKVRKGINDE